MTMKMFIISHTYVNLLVIIAQHLIILKAFPLVCLVCRSQTRQTLTKVYTIIKENFKKLNVL